MAEVMSEEQMELLESFGMKYLCGELPTWFYVVWLTVMTVPLFKSDKQEAVRPLGVRNQLVREFHKAEVVENKEVFVKYLEPEQLAMSVAGGGKLVFSVRMLAEDRTDFVIVKIDMENAFNAVSRASILEGLEDEPSLQHLAWHAATVLAPAPGLESGGNKWGESEEGTTQGDPLSAPYFNVSWHRDVRVLNATLSASGGMAKFGMDDGYAAGPAHVIFSALEKFARDVKSRCSLVWERTKTEVFTWDGVLPEQATPGLTRAGVTVDGVFEPGFLCYGVPVGTQKYVEYMLNRKIEDNAKGAKNVSNVLGDERQALWTALRLSLSQQLDYWLQLCYPTDIMKAAEKMDKVLWEVLEKTASSHIPRKDEQKGWECVLNVPVQSLQGKSFQEWISRQPVRLGGFGLRCQADLSPAAFIGALEQTVPSFIGERGVCPQLAHLVCPTGDTQRRWKPLVDSGCRTGVELVRAWDLLQGEARGMAEFLGEELEGSLAVPVIGMGEGSVNGSTRKKVTEQREKLRGSVLGKALGLHHDRLARPVLAWPQFDKLSSAWLLSLPGPHTGLASSVFTEAMCAHLCLPSPACRDRVGEKVGRAVVDMFGDAVMSAPLPGDTWRIRHDTVKSELNRLLTWCNLPATCEVFGLFSHLIPQEGLNRIERGRKRQGLVPDFQLQVPCPTGGKVMRLAELKVINCCQTRYTPGDRTRAVDKRSKLLAGEYRKKARDVDRLYGGAREGVAGAVENRLLQFGDLQGLVVGAFGEGSDDLHSLVQLLAESKVTAMGLTRGRGGTEAEIGVLVGQIRRMLSTTNVRAQAQCLLTRMTSIGGGVGQAAKRRKWAAMEEEKMRRERMAQWVGQVRGRNIVHRGQFLLH